MVYLFYLQEKSEREKKKYILRSQLFLFFIEIKKNIGDGSEMEKYSFTSKV
jgi:hypothetical protein